MLALMRTELVAYWCAQKQLLRARAAAASFSWPQTVSTPKKITFSISFFCLTIIADIFTEV